MNLRPPVAVAAPAFLFVTCQVGAQGAVKAELARWRSDVHLAFSRPGFLTFKLPPGHGVYDTQPLDLVFARSQGFSLGKVTGATASELAAAVWRLAGSQGWDSLHVWQRDTAPPGHRGFEPGVTPLAAEAATALRNAAPADVSPGLFAAENADTPRPTKNEEPRTASSGLFTANNATIPHWVLDCVIVEPNEWWIGYHVARDPVGCWPGGVPNVVLPPEAISRAYLKMEEALRWSQLPLEAAQHCAEVGCSPGGASQALLGRGLSVLGIDPAEVDPRLLAEPRFTQLQMRGADVKRRTFRHIRWLMCDINVAPQYTLDTIGAIVVHPSVHVQGLLLTLKLIDWQLAEELPSYLDVVRQWGFTDVRARQLAFNRQEVCVAATREPPRRGSSRMSAAKRHVPSRLANRRRRLA